MKPSLLVLAAGMGSRYGGLKQMDGVGPCGETIIDYALYDARLAGFDRAVIIIKHAIEHDFRETVGKRIEKIMDVTYAFQEFDKVPAPYRVAPDRVKPLGTGHAVWCVADMLDVPFAVINADDFYGADAFRKMHDFLSAVEDDDREARVSMLNAYPELKSMYSPDDGNSEVWYLRNATATVYSFTKPPRVIKF